MIKFKGFFSHTIGRRRKKKRNSSFENSDATLLSSAELRAFMRHDAHRIEKAFYNNIFIDKLEYFRGKRQNLFTIFSLLKKRRENLQAPDVLWAQRIAEEFEALEKHYIKEESITPLPVDMVGAREFFKAIRLRRSCRVWSEIQPSSNELLEMAQMMIEAASWAPCSGNRQAWRFRIMVDKAEKQLLKELKERHCFTAPCLIFVGIDRRLYGALGQEETGIFLDAAAAINQMILTAHMGHFGTCWNHFARDLIGSRQKNIEQYELFCERLNIGDYIEPIAVIALGTPKTITPPPKRMELGDLLID